MKKSKSIFGAYLAITLLSLTHALSAHAFRGGETGGGGDLCEDRIKIVRNDMKAWVQHGGPAGLRLESDLSAKDYSERMLAQIDSAKIRCVGRGDSGYPVLVKGTPKVCRFARSAKTAQITCDLQKFASLSESDQYVLIHHEYAGLAGLEIPNGDDSNYDLSNQISGFLVDKVVKVLAVKPAAEVSPDLVSSSLTISIVDESGPQITQVPVSTIRLKIRNDAATGFCAVFDSGESRGISCKPVSERFIVGRLPIADREYVQISTKDLIELVRKNAGSAEKDLEKTLQTLQELFDYHRAAGDKDAFLIPVGRCRDPLSGYPDRDTGTDKVNIPGSGGQYLNLEYKTGCSITS